MRSAIFTSLGWRTFSQARHTAQEWGISVIESAEISVILTTGEALLPGTDLRWFLVLRPVGDIIPPLELPDGMHVEFLQAIPIFESELAYKAAHGAEALLSLWEEEQVPFWDPGRSPVPL